MVAALLAIPVSGQIAFGWFDTADQKAYDAGYAGYWKSEDRGGALSCNWLMYLHLQIERAIADGKDSATVDAKARDSYNKIMSELMAGGRALPYGESAIYYVSGYFDAANTHCPEAFFETEFAGRP